ncbi:MAG TPA: hypothetical protein VGM25_06055 [Caulobacteraceae bacterium]|jgi:hypothetical protein
MTLLRSAALALLAAAAAVALSGCEQKIEAPFERGVCWHVVPLTGGKVKFNKLSENRPNLESCAASLEGMRERFLGLGGSQEDLVGAYQGNFLFLGRTGVFTGTSLTGARWPALVRTTDGRLAPPSAVAQ